MNIVSTWTLYIVAITVCWSDTRTIKQRQRLKSQLLSKDTTMDNLIQRLIELGYNLNTLEQSGNETHFMHRRHLVIIEQSNSGYQLKINSPQSRFKTICANEHRLLVKITDYFC